ncbi:unnamed protein product [Owenia fusiformis]|uniref:Uncharacterized protein n=1 Tax=Owenia fusiformis TaxID=6347 RepID=A0A8J1XTJ2_OWEFU|nr:unnamed protein product [Owenia fusiformis]
MEETTNAVAIITLFVTPVVIALGMVGNTLSLLVMLQKKNRKTNTGVYLAVIAVVDNCQMVTLLTHWLYGTVLMVPLQDMYCKVYTYFADFWSDSSIWIIVIMTIDRTVAIKLPLKKFLRARVISSSILGVTFFLLIIRNIPFLIYGFSKVDEVTESDICLVYDASLNSTAVVILPLFDVCFQSIIPFFILTTCNGIIIHALKKRKQQVANLGVTQNNPMMKARAVSITMMLLVISFSALVLTLPLNLLIFLAPLVENGTIDPKTFSIIFAVCLRLYFANNALNFYLSLIGGQKFKNDAKTLLCKCTPSQRETNRVTNGEATVE